MADALWTDEQKSAIEARNLETLVAAAAGSGKTAVLVERIIRMITEGENPLDIDRLLVVTFTKAAAAEMSQRIGDAIAEKLEKEPQNTHLKRQLALLGRADIKTIDSFFLKVVKENYNIVGIDPSVRTADEAECEVIKDEVIEQVFEELYAGGENKEFFALAESFSGDTSDRELKELIMRVYSFVQSSPYPEQWLDEVCESYNIDAISGSLWEKMAVNEAVFETRGLLTYLYQAEELIDEYGIDGYKKSIQAELNQLSEICRIEPSSYEECCRLIDSMKFENRIGIYKGDEKEAAELIKMLRKYAKDGMTSLKNKFFSFSPERASENIYNMYPAVKGLCDTVRLFSRAYAKAKAERMLMDFNDYGHFCIKILLEEGSAPENPIPTAAAKAIISRYDEILIDEYQDSNYIQEMVLSAVAGRGKGRSRRFIVGDVKQSIYKFRMARPEIFMSKYNSFDYGASVERRRIDLFKNFRSRANVLDCANYLFSRLMSKDTGGIEYDERAALHTGAEYPERSEGRHGGASELYIINRDTDEDADSDDDMSAAELEAILAADKIREMIRDGFMVWDKGLKEYRRAQYGDFVVLMRSKRNWSGVFSDVFERELIPAYAEATEGYFDTVEVSMAINFLTIIDNPMQDIPLTACLHSGIYRFTSSELLEIRLEGGGSGFYDSMINYMNNNENEISGRIRQFAVQLEKWRNEAAGITISRLLNMVLSDTGYFDYASMMANGKARQANLRMLAQKALEFEKSRLTGLFNFVRYIEKMKKQEIETGEAARISEADNIVRIMTIHKSKGLEFPVVVLCGLGKKINREDLRKSVLLHQEYGIGCDCVDYENRIAYSSISKAAVAAHIDRENIAEEIRVLYVALTRAKEKLVLIGSVSNMKKRAAEWTVDAKTGSAEIPAYRIYNARTYLDWIAPALMKHRDGKPLRDAAGFEFNLCTDGQYADSSNWYVDICSREDIINVKSELELNREAVSREALGVEAQSEGGFDADCLYWEYPNKAAVLLPSNVSISEVKRKYGEAGFEFEDTEEAVLYPEFSPAGKDKAASRGTAMHTLMERLDFYREWTNEEVRAEAAKLVKAGILTEDEASLILYSKIVNFFKSDVAKRIRSSAEVCKEAPFAMVMKPYEVFAGDYEGIDESVLIHGIIDCYFVENDKIVLLDYKSDRVTNETDFIKRYSIQLDLYKKALEQSTGMEVDESLIYSFYLDKIIKMP